MHPRAMEFPSPAMLALDLGAESGRAMLGHFDGERIRIREAYRFPNDPVVLPTGLHWDALRIHHHILAAISAAGAISGGAIESLGIDAWAVDFGLLDRTGTLIGNPHHYRDKRTAGMLERAFQRVPREEIYRATGIQAMPINTLSQLLAMEGSPALSIADTLLLIPDLLRYWLSGEKTAEYTVATTTQLYDHEASNWAWDIIDRLGIPANIFPPIGRAGVTGAPLHPKAARQAGLRDQPAVVTVASHDTASAVVTVPARAANVAYISSGTWSLVGVELPEPVLTDAAMEANFTNEGGAFGTIRFLKNVMGLWLLQECRRSWARAGASTDYGDLAAAASGAPPFQAIFDPDHPAFLAPDDMPAAIAEYCHASGQAAPEEIGTISRSIMENLALKYRWTIERLRELTNRPIEAIHIVGGGARNEVLCQFTADATRLPVIAGPVEATALGNLLVQAVALGHLHTFDEIRAVVRASTDLQVFEPIPDHAAWDDAYGKFLALIDHEKPDTNAIDR